MLKAVKRGWIVTEGESSNVELIRGNSLGSDAKSDNSSNLQDIRRIKKKGKVTSKTCDTEGRGLDSSAMDTLELQDLQPVQQNTRQYSELILISISSKYINLEWLPLHVLKELWAQSHDHVMEEQASSQVGVHVHSIPARDQLTCECERLERPRNLRMPVEGAPGRLPRDSGMPSAGAAGQLRRVLHFSTGWRRKPPLTESKQFNR